MARVDVEIRQSTLVRTLPLRVEPDGVPAPGYHVTNVVISPAAVTIEGTLEALQQTDSIDLGQVDITGEPSDVTRAVTIELPPGLSMTESRVVTVVVQIGPIEGDFTLSLTPALVGLADDLTAELGVEAVELTLNGPLPLLSQLTAEDLGLTLDVSDQGAGTHEIDVELTVPEGAVLQSLQPETVSVTLTAG
jgi:YbbR domain-containing protein